MKRAEFDLAINMSGLDLGAKVAERIEEWDVPDPVSMSYEDHCQVRDEIEKLVMQLILRLRSEQLKAR